MIDKYFDILHNEALKSNISVKMAACLLYNKKIIGSVCSNLDRTHYHNLQYGSFHAEARAIIAFFGKRLIFDNVRNIWCLNGKRIKADIFVLRINKLTIIGNSRPCYHCLQMMKEVGLRKIYYTTGLGNEIVSESIKNMLSIQASHVTKLYDLIKYNITDTGKFNSQYIDILIVKYIPDIVKYENLMYFIKYNFNIYCKTHSYKFTTKKDCLFINIYNKQDILIKKSIIV
jgi:hypothetical protein